MLSKLPKPGDLKMLFTTNILNLVIIKSVHKKRSGYSRNLGSLRYLLLYEIKKSRTGLSRLH